MEENTATLEDVIIRSRRTFSIQSMHQFSPDCRRQHQKGTLVPEQGGVAGSYRGKEGATDERCALQVGAEAGSWRGVQQ